MNLEMPNFKAWLMSRIVYPDVNGTDFIPAKNSNKSCSETVRVITHIGNIIRTLNYIYLRHLGVKDDRTDAAVNSTLTSYFHRRQDQTVDLADNKAVAYHISKTLVKYIRNFRMVLLGIKSFEGKAGQTMDHTMTEIYNTFVTKLQSLESSAFTTSEFMKYRNEMHPAAYYYCLCRLTIQNFELVTKDILFQGASEITIGWFIQKSFLGDHGIAWEALEEVYTRLALESTLKKISIKKIPTDIIDENALKKFLFKKSGKGVENTFKFWDFMRRNIMENLFNIDEVPGEKQAHRLIHSIDVITARRGLFPTLLVMCPSLIQNQNLENNLMELFLERVLEKGAGRDFVVRGEVTVGKIDTTNVRAFLKTRLENIKNIKEMEAAMQVAMEDAGADQEAFIDNQALEYLSNLSARHIFDKDRWKEFIRQSIMLARGGSEIHWKIANRLFELMFQHYGGDRMRHSSFQHVLVFYSPDGSWIRTNQFIPGHVYDMRKYIIDIGRQVQSASNIQMETVVEKIEEMGAGLFEDNAEMDYIPFDEAVAIVVGNDEEEKIDENLFVCPICQEEDDNPFALHTMNINGNKISHCIYMKCSGDYRKYFSMCCICRADL